ncbi:uncharacterized protein LOC134282319 [Saccostrea cucullata]|uniref:uncharacterized protein LOC134282319 n=1 Tax=Saccostrea cuccullata TaxID=36930 RepID=UPI002ED15387
MPGFRSDNLEAFVGGMRWIPNIGRMMKRVDFSCQQCKEYLAFVMESTMGVRRVPHPDHTPSTTAATTTTQHTTQNTTPKGVGCPTCDSNLNCVWSNYCQTTESCLVRQVTGFPFSTHCADKVDCSLMKQRIPDAEIFCCNDESCIHSILGYETM